MWFVWDHKRFFTDLINEWVGDAPADLLEFIPYEVHTDLTVTDGFEVRAMKKLYESEANCIQFFGDFLSSKNGFHGSAKCHSPFLQNKPEFMYHAMFSTCRKSILFLFLRGPAVLRTGTDTFRTRKIQNATCFLEDYVGYRLKL